MEDFKLTNFAKRHPGLAFPTFRSLSAIEVAGLRERLAHNLNLEEPSDAMDIVLKVDSTAEQIAGVDATLPTFDLVSILKNRGVEPMPRVLLNWYRFDRVDEMALVHVSRWFSDLWYPASDDLDVFDESCRWVLSVAHHG